MNPYHNRLLSTRSFILLPYIQIQAIFSLIVKGRAFAEILLLRSTFSIVIRLIYTVIRMDVYRYFPSQFPNGLTADKGNTLICNDVIRLFPDEGAV